MKTEESNFVEAIERPVGERSAFIQQECHENEALRRRVEALVAAHEKEDGFLDFNPAETTDAAWKVDAGKDIGPYRLLQKLGEGGFGVVFMAEQRHPIRRKVALKVIKPGMDSKVVVARFEAERQALAMMDHPNIARVFDGGAIASGDRPYFVMELVKGVPITEFCDANSFSTAERLQLFISVCNAVHHAHQKGIIHRDIKPSNVMVTLHDGKPVVKVIDFGVAKALHQRLTEKTLFTQYGMMVGTPQYMSPEQAEISGLDVDTRSDVYSLAVLLYELVTGTTPLQSESLREAGYQELQRMIREEEAVKPSQRLSSSGQKLTVLAKHRSVSPDRLPREIRGDLDWIVMKGLEKDRRRRYDSASDFATDIQRALNQEPVNAGPPSLVYRSKKFVVRNRGRVGFALAAAMVLATATFAFAVHRYQTHAVQQQDEARLINAVDEATSAMVAVVDASPADERWASTDFLVSRVQDLVSGSNAGRPTLDRATKFLDHYEAARRDRMFALAMEDVLIERGTHRDLESWTKMEQELRRILRERGYDVGVLDPEVVGQQVHEDRANVFVTDALELWISARSHLAELGGPELTSDEMQAWTEAMCVADPDPLRIAIRKVIYATEPPSQSELERVVEQCDLAAKCPRKLSWLAESFKMLGDRERADEIHRFALMQHPSDLMLNFDYATTLMNEEQWDRAIRYYMRCTAIRPQVPGVWTGLAEAFRNNGELGAAEDALEVAKELERSSTTQLVFRHDDKTR